MADARQQMKETNRVKIEEVTTEPSYAESQMEMMIDMTIEDSFPASDPPSWTLGREVKHSRDLSQKILNLVDS